MKTQFVFSGKKLLFLLTVAIVFYFALFEISRGEFNCYQCWKTHGCSSFQWCSVKDLLAWVAPTKLEECPGNDMDDFLASHDACTLYEKYIPDPCYLIEKGKSSEELLECVPLCELCECIVDDICVPCK